MPHITSDHPQESVDISAETTAHPRPGWIEMIVGFLVLAIIAYGGGSQLWRLGFDPVTYGLIFAALSGIAGIAGFAAAVSLRIRSLSAFGIRRVSWRWVVIGVGAGIVAFVLKVVATLAYTSITGDNTNIQDVYAQGGSGGILSLILATVFLALLTPLGEELLFRGVITTGLLRYGWFIGVVGSALIFAFAHGTNIVFPTALITGLINGELRRRSGSVWPGFIAHAVINLPTVATMVALGMR